MAKKRSKPRSAKALPELAGKPALAAVAPSSSPLPPQLRPSRFSPRHRRNTQDRSPPAPDRRGSYRRDARRRRPARRTPAPARGVRSWARSAGVCDRCRGTLAWRRGPRRSRRRRAAERPFRGDPRSQRARITPRRDRRFHSQTRRCRTAPMAMSRSRASAAPGHRLSMNALTSSRPAETCAVAWKEPRCDDAAAEMALLLADSTRHAVHRWRRSCSARSTAAGSGAASAGRRPSRRPCGLS